MANDWMTLEQAAQTLNKTPEEVAEILGADQVETLSVGDVDGPIELVPREYVESKLEGEGKEPPRDAQERDAAEDADAAEDVAESGNKRRKAQRVSVEPVQDDEDDVFRPVRQLTQVMTDRYEAIVESLRHADSTEAIERNLVQLKNAFEVTTEAISHMRDMQSHTAASFEDTLHHQNQIMENLLTSLQSSDRNTAAVTQYQQDFIDAIRRLPEPLQSIQDVQLGLIELEEKRQDIERERMRFEETDFGRLLTMLVYFLLATMLIGLIAVGWMVVQHLPDFLDQLRSSPARGLSWGLLRVIC